MPDIENIRKTAEKGAEWVTVNQPKKQPEKQPNQPKNSCFDCFSAVFRLFFPAVFRLFYRDPLGTLFGCFQCRAFGTSVGGRGDCKPWQVFSVQSGGRGA